MGKLISYARLNLKIQTEIICSWGRTLSHLGNTTYTENDYVESRAAWVLAIFMLSLGYINCSCMSSDEFQGGAWQ